MLQVPPFSLYFVRRDVQNFWSNELHQDGHVEIENLFHMFAMKRATSEVIEIPT